MTAPILEAVGLKKTFGVLTVANDISFSLGAGARQALIGPNGAGKTTLIGLLSGTIAADAGRITLLGADITTEPPARRVKRGLARTFQVSNLFWGLTVLENVFLAVSEHRAASGRAIRPAGRRSDLLEEARRIIDGLGLSEDTHRKISQLAYGRQRLVEIAIALSIEPRVLLLDEPAAGIPSGEVPVLLDALDLLPPDIAIVMIEHDMHVVRRFARQVMVLAAGAIVMSGSPAEVMSSPEVHALYLGSSGHERYAAKDRA